MENCKTTIYLVGTKESVKANSYEHITNNETEAARLAGAIEGGLYVSKEVKPQRRRK